MDSRIRILYQNSNTRDYVAKESSGHVVMPVGARLQLSRCSQVSASATSYFILPYNEFKFTFTNSKSSIQDSTPFIALLLELSCVSSSKIYLTFLRILGTCQCPCSRELPRIPTRKNFPGIPGNDFLRNFSWVRL